MFALPVPQQGFPVTETRCRVFQRSLTLGVPSGLPRVALLDGLPLGNHAALAGRLIIDDPDDIASRYTAGQRRHGTAMASLIVRGRIDAGGDPLKRPVYVHPILEPHRVFTDQEVFSEDTLFIDVLHRALRRVLDRESETAGMTEDVRIMSTSPSATCRQGFHSQNESAGTPRRLVLTSLQRAYRCQRREPRRRGYSPRRTVRSRRRTIATFRRRCSERCEQRKDTDA